MVLTHPHSSPPAQDSLRDTAALISSLSKPFSASSCSTGGEAKIVLSGKTIKKYGFQGKPIKNSKKQRKHEKPEI